jgi:hypothetical protein
VDCLQQAEASDQRLNPPEPPLPCGTGRMLSTSRFPPDGAACRIPISRMPSRPLSKNLLLLAHVWCVVALCGSMLHGLF